MRPSSQTPPSVTRADVADRARRLLVSTRRTSPFGVAPAPCSNTSTRRPGSASSTPAAALASTCTAGPRSPRVEACRPGISSARLMDAVGDESGARPVSLGDVTRLPFADASFDKLIISEVLEHLADDARGAARGRARAQAGRRLRDHGAARRLPVALGPAQLRPGAPGPRALHREPCPASGRTIERLYTPTLSRAWWRRDCR